jgi:hypothetical protein
MTSLLVFLVIFSLYLGFRIAQGRIISTLVMLHLFVFACFFLQLQSHIDPLVKNEIAVLKGEKNIKHAFHGRMQRWQKMINEFNQSALPYQIMNPSFAKLRSYGYMISGSHNDYLRILFLGGFLGLFLYLGFLYSIALGWSRLHFARKFLNTSILLILLLFSITAVPTVYAPMMYITMIVFSYSVYRK